MIIILYYYTTHSTTHNKSDEEDDDDDDEQELQRELEKIKAERAQAKVSCQSVTTLILMNSPCIF